MKTTGKLPWHGIEPAIDEILSDPIVLLLMRSDGVSSRESLAVLRCAALRAEHAETRLCE